MRTYRMKGHDRLHSDDEYIVVVDHIGVVSITRLMGSPTAYAALRCAELRMRGTEKAPRPSEGQTAIKEGRA